LPFLPSFRLGKRRLVRVETRRKWLEDLEQTHTGEAAGKASGSARFSDSDEPWSGLADGRAANAPAAEGAK
jgi:hypothetical protein